MPFTTDTTAPTPDDVFSESKLKWPRLGFNGADDIAEIVEDAIGYVTWITGRYFSDFVPVQITGQEGSPVSTDYTPVPLDSTPELIRMMRRAVRLRTEQEAVQDQDGYVKTANDDLIQSFSAGPYSETRRDTSTLRGGRSAQKLLLNSHPGLNDLLTQLMTDERREYWNYVLSGTTVPWFANEEIDWSLVGKAPLFPSVAGDPMAPTPSIDYPWYD